MSNVKFKFAGKTYLTEGHHNHGVIEVFEGEVAFDFNSGRFLVTSTYRDIETDNTTHTDVYSWNGEKMVFWRRIINQSSAGEDYYGPGQAIIGDSFERGSFYMSLVGFMNHPILNRPLFYGLGSLCSNDYKEDWELQGGLEHFNATDFDVSLGLRDQKLIAVDYYTVKNSGERKLIHSISGSKLQLVGGAMFPMEISASTHMSLSGTTTTCKIQVKPSSLVINSLCEVDLESPLPLGTQVNDNIRGERYVIQPYSGMEYGIQILLDSIVDSANK